MWLHFEQQGIKNTQVSVAARQMKVISSAAQDYLQANYTRLEGTATPYNPAMITVATLKKAAYLPPGYNEMNPWGQHYEVEVLQPTEGRLQALVLTTGKAIIPRVVAPTIATQVGAEGGIIPYAGQYGKDSTVAVGAYGGWEVPMNYYHNPGSGHLATLLYFSDGDLRNDYLYRAKVPGKPELNQMQTTLDMSGNDISGAKNITTRDLTATDQVTATNRVNTRTLNASSSVSTYKVNTKLGHLSPGYATAGGWCSSNGDIAAASSGKLLSCVNGRWSGDSGKETVIANANSSCVYLPSKGNWRIVTEIVHLSGIGLPYISIDGYRPTSGTSWGHSDTTFRVASIYDYTYGNHWACVRFNHSGGYMILYLIAQKMS